MSETILLLLGLTGLWIGTEMVIKGAMKIADYYKLSHLFVGVTILAVGTDLPEIFISIEAAIQKQTTGIETSGIIIGNAIGSSFSQITLVLGVAGLFGYLTLVRKHLYADGVMILVSILILFIMGFDGMISREEGLIMILIYLIYYVRSFQQEKAFRKMNKKRDPKLPWHITLLVLGLFVVIFASDIVVHNAISLADHFQVRQSFVGILIIGLGTSLPELALSINAARKKAHSLSVGNLIGSNIFDLLMPVGLGATIAELKFNNKLIYFDLPILMVATFTALFFFYRHRGLKRSEAIILVAIYVIYASLKMFGY